MSSRAHAEQLLDDLEFFHQRLEAYAEQVAELAAAAAQALRKRDFKGFVARELLGERDLTMKEVTQILGGRLGKPGLQYVQFP